MREGKRHFFRFWGIVGALLMLLQLSMSNISYGQNYADKEPKVIEAYAPKMYAEYDNNPLRAEQKYSQYELVKLFGKISDFKPLRNRWDFTVILEGERFIESINVTLDRRLHPEYLMTLNKGELLEVFCPTNQIQMRSYSLDLKGCITAESIRIEERKEALARAERQKEEARVFAPIDSHPNSNFNSNVNANPNPLAELEEGELLPQESKQARAQMPAEKPHTERNNRENDAIAKTINGRHYLVYFRYGEENPRQILHVALAHFDGVNYRAYSDEEQQAAVLAELKMLDTYLEAKSIDLAIEQVNPYNATLYRGVLSGKNVLLQNNLAYYLEQNGRNLEAMIILEEVVKRFPNRTPAHINLADAYWDLGSEYAILAKEHYKIYRHLMEKNGRGHRIPQRVYERLQAF